MKKITNLLNGTHSLKELETSYLVLTWSANSNVIKLNELPYQSLEEALSRWYDFENVELALGLKIITKVVMDDETPLEIVRYIIRKKYTRNNKVFTSTMWMPVMSIPHSTTLISEEEYSELMQDNKYVPRR